MRLFTSLIAGLAVFAVASTASAALTITASSTSDLLNLLPGEVFTIDITIQADQGSTLNALGTPAGETVALGFRAANYDPGVIAFQSAVIPASVFNITGFPLGGLSNNASGVEEAPEAGVRAGFSVNLFQGVSATPAGGVGPDSFSVTFQAVAGSTVIDLGALSDYSDAYGVEAGADNSQIGDTSIAINVVPAPGTALLMGLGLAGLAAAGRKE